MVDGIVIVVYYTGIVCTPNKEFHRNLSGSLVMASSSFQFSRLIILVRASHIGIVGFRQSLARHFFNRGLSAESYVCGARPSKQQWRVCRPLGIDGR